MLTFGFDASGAFDRLGAMPDKLHDALLQKVDSLRQKLQNHVTDDKLSGQVLHVRSGALRASIGSEIVDGNGRIGARIGSYGDIKYAAIHEFGGKTCAHEIVPDKSQALAFLLHDKLIFARRVHHPGSVMPERSYLRSALADMQDEIADALTQAAIKGLSEP